MEKEQIKKEQENEVIEEYKRVRDKLLPEEHQAITRILYRDGFRLMSVAFFSLLFVFAVYVIFDKAVEPNDTEVKYFAQKNDGTLTIMTPLETPNLSDKAIISWATNAIPDIYSFDNVNYLRHFNRVVGQYFSRAGGIKLMEALETGVPSQKDYIMENEFAVSTSISAPAVIEKQGTFEGKYIWQVAVPVFVTYSNVLKKSEPQARVIRIIIERTPETQTDHGIEIVKFLMVSPKSKAK